MTATALHADAFYREVAQALALWAIRDDDGFPAPLGGSGKRSMPFWSSESRARRIIESVPAYRGFVPVRIDWCTFEERWAPGLESDGLLVGVNWAGPRATGYDLQPSEVVQNVAARISQGAA